LAKKTVREERLLETLPLIQVALEPHSICLEGECHGEIHRRLGIDLVERGVLQRHLGGRNGLTERSGLLVVSGLVNRLW